MESTKKFPNVILAEKLLKEIFDTQNTFIKQYKTF